jgi:hypothetical protein
MNEPVLYQEWNAAQWPRSVDAIQYQGWLIRTPYRLVPWCAEHNHEWISVTHGCWARRGHPTECRLEDPPRHIKLGGSDE